MKSITRGAPRMVRLAAGVCLLLAAAPPAVSTEPEIVADALVNRVWMQRVANRPGVIRVFLADGALLMDSCWETFRLERWRREGDSVRWTEDSAEIHARIVSLDAGELVLEVRLSGGVERQEFVPASPPYLCPDMPKGAARELAPPLSYGCDDAAGGSFAFSVRYLDEAVELGLPPRFDRPGLTVVPQVRAASGSKYERDGVLFWVAGERVRLDVDGTSFGPCAERPSEGRVLDAWQQARADGVTFRALGQEPFWKLDVVPGRWIRFELVGADPVSTPVPECHTVDGTTIYHAVTEAHDLVVAIEPTVCYDSMSGHRFETTVTVTLDGSVYDGCGRAP